MKKFTIIGAGSSYTPELLEGLNKFRETVQFDEICLYDIDESRISIMHDFVKRFADTLNYKTKFTYTTDLVEAITDAEFINTQIRVGGNECRIKDEKIPLKYNLIGQETTGAGGFTKALRTIPVMLEIARTIEKHNPNAWIINYTNPTGLVTEAVTKYTNAKIVGFCSAPILPKMWAKKELGLDYDRLQYDLTGLNHLNFAYNFKIDGEPISEEIYEQLVKSNTEVDNDLIRLIGCIPSPYLQYYYHTNERLEKLKHVENTRGEVVLKLEREIYEELKDDKHSEKPPTLLKRGGGGYSDVAIGFIDAVANNKSTDMFVNVPNNGAIPFLPNEAIVEINCLVNKSGIYPIVRNNTPEHVQGLIAEVKTYESLAVEAAVHGDREKARLALLAHPLVRNHSIVDKLLDELLEANKAYLPQFFK